MQNKEGDEMPLSVRPRNTQGMFTSKERATLDRFSCGSRSEMKSMILVREYVKQLDERSLFPRTDTEADEKSDEKEDMPHTLCNLTLFGVSYLKVSRVPKQLSLSCGCLVLDKTALGCDRVSRTCVQRPFVWDSRW